MTTREIPMTTRGSRAPAARRHIGLLGRRAPLRLRAALRLLTLPALLLGLVLPAAADADLRFGPALASSASDAGVGGGSPDVAGNPAGVVVAVYRQKLAGLDHVYARVKPAGTAAFGPAAHLAGPGAGSPAAAVARDGTITVAWQLANPCVGSSVWIATAPSGGTFGAAVKVSDNAFSPHLAAAPDGTVAFLYGHDTGGCATEERAQMRPLAGPPVDQAISDVGYKSVYTDDAAIGIDDNGTAVAAFGQSLNVAPFTHVLRVARRPAGGGWTGTTLSGPATAGNALAVAPDGNAVVAYNRKSNTGYGVEVRSLAAGASTFGAPQTVTDLTTNDPLSGLAIGAGGAAAVTTSGEHVASRAAGASAFGAAAGPSGLPVSASNLQPAFAATGELALLDAEKLPGATTDYSLVARVAAAAGADFGAPHPTGLVSSATGAAALAPFGTGDIAIGWANKPTGASEFAAGLALGDGTAPTLGGSSAPTSGAAGAPLSFSVTPSDDLGPASVRWDFGGGVTAETPATTHAFSAPGPATWSVTATDQVGHATTGAGGLTIIAPPTPLSVTIAKPRRGTRGKRLRSLHGTAGGPAVRVQVAVVRLVERAKRPAATRIVACASLGPARRLSARPRRAIHHRCSPTRYLTATGTRRWSLRLPHGLPPGHYAAWARAVSRSGARSRVVRTTFVLRP